LGGEINKLLLPFNNAARSPVLILKIDFWIDIQDFQHFICVLKNDPLNAYSGASL
jgi:hypothetical protein